MRGGSSCSWKQIRKPTGMGTSHYRQLRVNGDVHGWAVLLSGWGWWAMWWKELTDPSDVIRWSRSSVLTIPKTGEPMSIEYKCLCFAASFDYQSPRVQSPKQTRVFWDTYCLKRGTENPILVNRCASWGVLRLHKNNCLWMREWLTHLFNCDKTETYKPWCRGMFREMKRR